MQVPVTSDTWVFAAGGKSHDDYSSCPFRVNAAGEVYAKTGIFGNVVSNEKGTSGNFDNGFSADSSFGVTGGARTDFDNLVVKNITAENILATNVLANYVTANTLNAAVANLQTIFTLSLNALDARLGTVEANYITASEVHTNYLDVRTWTHDGLIRADRIDVDTIVAKLAQVSQVQVMDLLAQDGVHCRRITFGVLEINASCKWKTIVVNDTSYTVLCQN